MVGKASVRGTATILQSQEQSIPCLPLRRTGKALLDRAFGAVQRRFAAASAIRSADLPYAFAPTRYERAPIRCEQRLKHPIPKWPGGRMGRTTAHIRHETRTQGMVFGRGRRSTRAEGRRPSDGRCASKPVLYV